MQEETLKFHKLLIHARDQASMAAQKAFKEKAIEAHIFGSVGRNDSDQYSDLDIWFTFKDEDIKNILAQRRESYSSIGNVIHVCEPPQNSPTNGVHSFVLYKTPAGLLQVDYYLCPQSTSFQTGESRKIFGDVELPQGKFGINPQKVSVDETYRIDFVIFIAFIAIKNLARKEKGALTNLFREYDYLSARYAIKTDVLLDRENTFVEFRKIIASIKKISNDHQKIALTEIDDFSQKVESVEEL